MNTKEFLKEIQELKNIEKLNIEKLPEIPLYMDQITTFIQDTLEGFNRDKNKKSLTKTMINNYTKNKIVSPPEKKKYTKNHLISLILIYHLKSVLSINDISSILNNISGKEDEFYSYFNNKLKEKICEMEYYMSEKLKNNDKDINFLIFDLLIDSYLKKLLVEKMLDNLQNER